MLSNTGRASGVTENHSCLKFTTLLHSLTKSLSLRMEDLKKTGSLKMSFSSQDAAANQKLTQVPAQAVLSFFCLVRDK